MAEGEGWRPPRPCEAYRAEWELCRSAGHFLRHYYVHGERPACGQWRRDLVSCREWEERRSAEAQTLPAWTLLDVQQRLEHNLCPALELMGGRAERSCEGAELAGLADSLPPGPEGKPRVAGAGPNAMTGILTRNQGTERPHGDMR
ncbi:UPF0545 protein C22orf39 homolog isoform X2 [Bubalus bubalis]|uniref:UPF0545 protein C22orf39 homolog isoform X2 n=1 Tax=Bubalus bubalis TaxID=89462 RepID=UPI000DBC4935|nr:UPF0545 protein C22orf39 homolog isoform X2 [Bubalus bubalis]